MIERVARRLHQKNQYVVNAMYHLISVANVLHAENPSDVEDSWIKEYHLQNGSYDIVDTDRELVSCPPAAIQIGKGLSKADTEYHFTKWRLCAGNFQNL